MPVACYWHSLAMLEVFVWLERCGLNRDEIPPGTLYLLILKTLARHAELHGYEIANSIQRTSDDVLQVEEGSLYPALQRMLIKGWVTAEWGTTAGNRRARYYKLTAAGRKQLVLEISQFERVMGAIGRVIQTA
jgi:PadR family transcriptional regulator PadR